jgi:transcriptional regulator with XRE-family HTH domain
MKLANQDLLLSQRFHTEDVARAVGEWPDTPAIDTLHDVCLSATTLPQVPQTATIVVGAYGVIEEGVHEVALSPAAEIEPDPPHNVAEPVERRDEEDQEAESEHHAQSWGVTDLRKLGAIVRWLRKNGPPEEGKTQLDLAARMSLHLGKPVDQATISRIERGLRAPSRPTFVALARSLGAIKASDPALMLLLAAFNPEPDPVLNGMLEEIKATIATKCFGAGLDTILADSDL